MFLYLTIKKLHKSLILKRKEGFFLETFFLSVKKDKEGIVIGIAIFFYKIIAYKIRL